jgi:hypothetical protein
MHRGTRERSTTPCRHAYSLPSPLPTPPHVRAHHVSSIRSQPLRVLLPGWLPALPGWMPPSHRTRHRFQDVVCADSRACWYLAAGCCRQHRHLQQLLRCWPPVRVPELGCCHLGAAAAMPAALATSRQTPHATPPPANTDTDPGRDILDVISRHASDINHAYFCPRSYHRRQEHMPCVPTARPACCKHDMQLLCCLAANTAWCRQPSNLGVVKQLACVLQDQAAAMALI